jgi:hypothetical protein
MPKGGQIKTVFDKLLSGSESKRQGREMGRQIEKKQTAFEQGCQMVCFQTKNPNLGTFWGSCNGKSWNIL